MNLISILVKCNGILGIIIKSFRVCQSIEKNMGEAEHLKFKVKDKFIGIPKKLIKKL